MNIRKYKDNPLVSIVVPAYNAASFIGQTLKSIIEQTYKNIEVIVVNDGSKDNTADLVRSFAQADSRITLVEQQNLGVSAARNLGIEKLKGEFIALIDADDIYYPQAIEKLTNTILQADDSVGVVYGWSAHIDESENLTGSFNCSTFEGDVYKDLIQSQFVGNASAFLARRSCIDKTGYFDRQILPGCADWDFLLKLGERYQFKVVPEFLIGYRKLSTSMSSDFAKMEKAYQQIIDNACKRNPALTAESLCASKSNYFIYLSTQSRITRKYYQSISYLWKALILDKQLLSNSYVRQNLFLTFADIAISPLGFILNMDNAEWKKFLRKLKRSYSPVNNLSDLYKLAPKSSNK